MKSGAGDAGAALASVTADDPSYIGYRIDDTWKRFEILFADAKQDRNNPGQKSPGDKLAVSQLVGMAIQFNSDSSTIPATSNDVEVWIDDVGFIR